MRRYRINLLCTLVLLIGAAGCEPLAVQPGGNAEVGSDMPAPSVSVEYLTGRLDMKILRSNGSLARLGNATNRVLIFPDPGGSVRVNGVRLSFAGAIEQRGDMLFVPSSLVGAIRRQLRPLPPKAATDVVPSSVGPVGVVVLDAGHGGKDPGAISRTGHYEKHVVFSVTRQIAEMLRRRGVRVIMTRTSDVFISLDKRVRIANKTRPHLFVSIHADAARNIRARGYTIYYPRRAKKLSPSHRAAKAVAGKLAGLNSHRRGVRRHDKNLRVLEKTRCPAILVELGYLSNRMESRLLNRAAYQRALAGAITEAIVNHLKTLNQRA